MGMFLNFQGLMFNLESSVKNASSQVKQEANQYTMKTVSGESNILNITNEEVAETALDKAFAKVSDVEIKLNIDLFNQIFDKKNKWGSNGYKAWKETTCQFVKEGGQKTVNAMKASKQKVSGEVADRLEREYQENISEQIQHNEWIEQKFDRHFDSDNEEFTSSYVKKEKPSIDYLFED